MAEQTIKDLMIINCIPIAILCRRIIPFMV